MFAISGITIAISAAERSRWKASGLRGVDRGGDVRGEHHRSTLGTGRVDSPLHALLLLPAAESNARWRLVREHGHRLARLAGSYPVPGVLLSVGAIGPYLARAPHLHSAGFARLRCDREKSPRHSLTPLLCTPREMSRLRREGRRTSTRGYTNDSCNAGCGGGARRAVRLRGLRRPKLCRRMSGRGPSSSAFRTTPDVWPTYNRRAAMEPAEEARRDESGAEYREGRAGDCRTADQQQPDCERADGAGYDPRLRR